MRLTLLAAALVLTGCSAPVIGDWRSDQELGNERHNTLSVYDDLTAEAVIFATPKNDLGYWVRFDYDADWEDLDDEFDFDMECKEGPCEGEDFTMSCQVLESDDGVEMLDCEGEDRWQDYPFDWERDE